MRALKPTSNSFYAIPFSFPSHFFVVVMNSFIVSIPSLSNFYILFFIFCKFDVCVINLVLGFTVPVTMLPFSLK